jgi:hypothetical protein
VLRLLHLCVTAAATRVDLSCGRCRQRLLLLLLLLPWLVQVAGLHGRRQRLRKEACADGGACRARSDCLRWRFASSLLRRSLRRRRRRVPVCGCQRLLCLRRRRSFPTGLGRPSLC